MADLLTDDKLNWLRDFTGLPIDMHDIPEEHRSAPAPTGSIGKDDTVSGGPPGDVHQPAGAPPPDPAVEKAKTDIGAKFSVKVGSEGNAPWNTNELAAVSGAFDAVPNADKDALKGIEVNRVGSFGNAHHTAADYESGVSSEGPVATETRKVLVGDETFVDKSSGHAVPVPPAEQTRAIVHEFGHVVAKKAQVEADFADAQAVVTLNKEIADLKKITDEIADLETKLGDERTKSNDLFNTHPKGADLDRLKAMDKAINEKEVRVKELHKQVDRLRAEIGTATQAWNATKAAATRVPAATVQAGQAQVETSGIAAAGASWKATTESTRLNQDDFKDSQEYRLASDAVEREMAVAAGAVRDGVVGRGKGQQRPDDLDDKLAALVAARDAARKKLATRSRRTRR